MVIWAVSFRKTSLWISLLCSLCVVSYNILFQHNFLCRTSLKFGKDCDMSLSFYINLYVHVHFCPFPITTLFSVLIRAIPVYVFRDHNILSCLYNLLFMWPWTNCSYVMVSQFHYLLNGDHASYSAH